MKTFLTIIAVIILAVFAYEAYNRVVNGSTVKTLEFRQAHELLNLRIDSLKHAVEKVSLKVDSVNIKVTYIAGSVDTLKYGQQVIYDEVKKDKKISFWDMFK